MVHARSGDESRLGGRLAVESVAWRLVCVVEKESLMGTVR